MIHPAYTALLATLAAAWLIGCGGGAQQDSMQPEVLVETAAFPATISPADNPLSEAQFQLGRTLFYDMRLSANGIQSCASCHLQSKAFTDGLALSRGATGEFTPRNAQSLSNLAWRQSYAWARPDLLTLEQQMHIPLYGTKPVEMGLTPDNEAGVLARFRNDLTVLAQFKAAFPLEADPVSIGTVVQAIASFQRELVSNNSLYDRALQGSATLDAAQQRGKALFFGDQARCSRCHGGFNFDGQASSPADNSLEPAFQNTGLYNVDGAGAYPAPNRGLFEVTGLATDMGKFRIASLRNIALTAPYMHDGSMATLQEVLDAYAAGGRLVSNGPYAGDGRLNPFKNPLLNGIALTAQDKLDLMAFLKTLTDTTFVSNPRFSAR